MEKQKKTSKEQNKLIAQRNQLVEGKYNYSLWELRVFIEMVQRIDRNDKEFKPMKLYFNDLINEYGKKSNDDYRLIQNAAIKLMRKLVRIEYTTDEGEERIYHSPLIQGVSTPKQMDDGFDKYIELKFPEEITPLLLDLKKNYLLYDKRNILHLKSKFSVRIYQLLKKHERETKDVAIVEYTIAEIRGMLLVDDEGNPTEQYKRYSQFEKRVILIAQKELQKHTDIAFSFDKIKKGRRIHSIRFFIQKNRKQKTKEKQSKPIRIRENTSKEQPTPKAPQRRSITETPAPNDPIHNNQAYQKLIQVGVSSKKSVELTKKYDVSYIIASIKKAIEANKVSPKNNLSGFIIKCIEDGTYKSAIEKQQTKKRKEKNHQNRLDTHLQIMKIKNEYESARTDYLDKVQEKLDKKTTKEIVQIAREKFSRAAEMTEKGVIESIYFGFAVTEFYEEQKAFPIEYTNFENYINIRYNLKVTNDNLNGWYEIVN